MVDLLQQGSLQRAWCTKKLIEAVKFLLSKAGVRSNNGMKKKGSESLIM